MANLSQLLKSEITRLARKEVKSEVQALRKASTQYRADIAALKRQLTEQQRLLAHFGKSQRRLAMEPTEEATPLRFRAAGFATLRKKLDLSAADMGKLIGVSLQTIYHWEKGESKPRQAQLSRIAEVRKLGKRAVREKLAG